MALNNSRVTEVEFLKNEVAELNKQYYTALKKIKKLIEENDRLKKRLKNKTVSDNTFVSGGVPDLPESKNSPLSTKTKVYPFGGRPPHSLNTDKNSKID